MQKLKKQTSKKTNKSFSFEEKLEKLKKVVEDLEEGEIPLKESTNRYQESLDLINQCHEELKDAELKIEKIMKKDGQIVTGSYDE